MYRRIAVIVCGLVCASAQASDGSLLKQIDQLAASEPAQQMHAARALAATNDARATAVLDALVGGQLYRRRSDDKVFVARRDGRGYSLTDPLTGEATGTASRREVSRIAVTVEQRETLRELILTAKLSAPDAMDRRAALDALLDDPQSVPLELVRSLAGSESDRGVRRRLQLLTLLREYPTLDGEAQLRQVQRLADYQHPAARNHLRAIAGAETVAESLRDAAAMALRTIDRRQQWYSGMQTAYFGISLGSVLVLAAIGLAITFGVMGVINMAHGELIMLGAYSTWALQTLMPGQVGLALVLAVPLAFLVSGLAGIAIERSVIRHLYRRPAETLLATFGVSLILQQAVRSLFGPLNRTVVSPSWMSGAYELTDGLTFTYNRLVIIVFCLCVFGALLAVLRFTRFGLQLRAVAQNRQMARALGVRSARIDALTFGLGSGVAGIAGVALSQLTNVGPNLGQAYIVDSFLVVVVGGVGNLWGTLVAGLSLGVANKLLEPMTGAVLAKIVLLLAIIVFIQKRPRGLFPQRGRAADS